MCCALICSAQEPERLPDGTLLILIEGKRYRALPADRMRELINQLEDKKLLERKVVLLEQQIVVQERLSRIDERERQLYAEQIGVLNRQIELYKTLFEKADKAARPGRIRKFLDSPVSALLFQAAIPTITLLLRTR